MSHSIFLVDDDNDILTLLAEALRAEGYQPHSFTSPARALASLLNDPPSLLVTDLLMPGMSGEELIEHVRERLGATLPIVVMSASATLSSKARSAIQAYFSKPFELDDFIDTIVRLLGD
jgi:DNA-binding NtrC family response regulator